MFSNILKRIGKSGTNMSRGALVDLMESIWRDALSKLQPVASASVISPAHSVVADGLPDRKRTSSASPEDDKISTTSSKRFRLNRQSMADPEVVIVVTKILHIRNLDPKMENDAIIHEFRQFGIIPTFWRSFCLNFCYMEVFMGFICICTSVLI